MIAVSPVTWYRHARRASKENRPAEVPCGSCVACCETIRVPLTTADDPSLYELDPAIEFPTLKMQDGHCVYLVERRCTIYAQRPEVCWRFDCRGLLMTGVDKPAHVWNAVNERFSLAFKDPDDERFLRKVRQRVEQITDEGEHDAAVVMSRALSDTRLIETSLTGQIFHGYDPDSGLGGVILGDDQQYYRFRQRNCLRNGYIKQDQGVRVWFGSVNGIEAAWVSGSPIDAKDAERLERSWAHMRAQEALSEVQP